MEKDDEGKTAIDLVVAERARQIDVEGFSPAHDDRYRNDELATAAACYALPISISDKEVWGTSLIDLMWPLEADWWKPEQSRIRNMVKAAALLIAEIERIQRIEAHQTKE